MGDSDIFILSILIACYIFSVIVLLIMIMLSRRKQKESGEIMGRLEERITMTNGDMIRSMTDVELANFLATDAVIACVHCNNDLHTCGEDHNCGKLHEASVFWNWLGEEWQPGRWTFE